MEKYQVEIVERLRKVIDIDADSIRDAEEKVKDLYDRKEIVLNHDDLLLTEFNGKFGKNFETLRELIISEYIREQKRNSESIKAAMRLKKQRLGIDTDKKDQEMER